MIARPRSGGEPADQPATAPRAQPDAAPGAQSGAQAAAPPGATHLQQVLGQLRELILRGGFAPASRLEEKLLAERLGVSRTPVRLALQSLAQEGLLIYRPHRGFQVRSFTTREVVDAIEIRGRLEAFACEALASRGIGEAAAERVRRNLDETRQLVAQPAHDVADVDAWVRLNDAFHWALIGESGVTLIDELIRRIGRVPMASAALVPTMGDNVATVFDYVAEAVRMHEYVFDAIVRREPGRAHNLMLEHVHQGRLRMMSFIESWPLDATPAGYPEVRRDAAAPDTASRRRPRLPAADEKGPAGRVSAPGQVSRRDQGERPRERGR
ncbi:MAG: GntR family transcriptional regulator [Lautropia sp.]